MAQRLVSAGHGGSIAHRGGSLQPPYPPARRAAGGAATVDSTVGVWRCAAARAPLPFQGPFAAFV